ncbi:MAG: prolyl oligopeptidase family protein [bacterium]
MPKYPPTHTVDQVDDYHGIQVTDPYRWLENDVRQDRQVQTWVDAQRQLSDAYLRQLPERAALHSRLTELWNTPRFGVPVKRGNQYFYSYNDGLMNQPQVLVQSGPDGAPRVLLDPNKWSDTGTTALAAYFVSPDARFLAYLVQVDGSDWREARVLNVSSGEDCGDSLSWLKFTSLSWAADSSGFYYSRFPEVSEDRFHQVAQNNAVYFHRLGTQQSADSLVFATPEQPHWRFDAQVTQDGTYLVIDVGIGTDRRNQVLVQHLASDPSPRFLVAGFAHHYACLGHVDGELFFLTDLEAPNGRVIALRPASGVDALKQAREVVAESDSVLDSAHLCGEQLVLRYLQDASSCLQVVDLTGNNATELELPGSGGVQTVTGRQYDVDVFFDFSALNHAPAVYRLSLESQQVTVFKQVEVKLDLSAFVLKQIFFTSRDGTRVPMFICHKEGIQLDGTHPTLLYGYGGFNVSLTPDFSVARALWIEQGGVFAIANLRGGGEYGERWHAAGTRLHKQNVFDDFIAAAEYLIDTGYTAPAHLGVMGGSNGGLLVGAVVNQRPELFGAALALVGVMDMLRFHHFTAGVYWIDDYGSADDADEFAALYAYSPYHNLAPRIYPPILIGTADTDDRVVPGHSFKYAAKLQAVQQGDAPVLLRVESAAGHGLGTPTAKLIDEYADYWAFMFHHLRA